MDMNKKNEQVLVESEFAPLKRVVLAQSQYGAPTEENLEKYKDYLPDSPEGDIYIEKLYGKDVAEVYPELQKRWEAEKENLEKVLKKYGVEVLRPRLLTEKEKKDRKEVGYSNFFARDPFFVIGQFIVEGTMKYEHRIKEVMTVRHILEQEAEKNECLYLAAPQADRLGEFFDMKGPFLEGGDVLVLNKEIFVGTSGLASNRDGIIWLRNFLSNFDYTVTEVPLHPEILHLDCALSLLRDGLMIICEEAFPEGIPESLKEWDKVSVSLEDAQKLITNGLPLNEKVYVTDPEFRSSIGEQLTKRGIKVEYVDYSISRQFGGSFRCTTQPLLRINEKNM
ncbi:amidinotransferase family protein [Paenibacillus larvae subsp. larvae]|uniref:Amidinotransferase family protein n=2 Tax=Paenibacillus larvae TaxID=1464 RepID=A0A2L1U0W5_9BACL|nr:arginine deiminase family protein [Paenibacillus larvae]AVF26570.1 amidinotransferase family protein [Paenibacillus larvae subsp. larvae]AVF31302.1 amidinotransferase family protein [Paenibacillus larvae subsp. larvae]MCY7518381.1 arginine deiminase family protein [Paenibacillus larvae]MCY9502013.1 arginine deiminase family protein [Paenibacillus larvae]MCY9511053.1 arginine deiminase family protein [Paenibacillus larvae]